MFKLLGIGAVGQVNPGAVEIGGLGADACVNQHLRGLGTVGFHRNAGGNGSDRGEHLAADFPGVMPATPWVRDFGAGEGCTDCIDGVAAHGAKMGEV